MLPLDTIIHGHNVDTLGGFPDACIDLTVTSPPYDNLRTYKGFTFDFEGIAQQLYRVTKDGGVVVWVVSDATINGSETGTSFRQALRFMEIGFRLHDTMIYEKDSISFPETNRYYQSFEYMFVFVKGKIKTTNLLSDRKNLWYNGRKHIKGNYTLADGTRRRHNKQNLLKEYGVRFNVWRISNGANKTTTDDISGPHPAMFPEKLAADHILSWSNGGDIVLDPFCGSGTTCKMAAVHHRRYIGIDVAAEYVELSRRRVATIQPTLELV